VRQRLLSVPGLRPHPRAPRFGDCIRRACAKRVHQGFKLVSKQLGRAGMLLVT